MSSSPVDYVIGNQQPSLRTAPDRSVSYGDLAADLTADYGLVPDDWQRLVLDDWLGVGPDGRWAAKRCGLSVPRQNGKNAVVEMRELFGMVGRGERILHTAHLVSTAQEHFRRLKHFFGVKVRDPNAAFPELNALVIEVRSVNGQEAIYLDNGGAIQISARSKKAGRGRTFDTLVFDEAQDLADDELEALQPVNSSGRLGDEQTIFTGTPPGPSTDGEAFTRPRITALSGESKRLCWHEWSLVAADLDAVDLDDPELWAAANPGLGRRLRMSAIETEREQFSDGGFARERLGWWASQETRAVINLDLWGDSIAAEPPAADVAPSAIGVDMSHDRVIAIAGCWKAEENVHIELVALDRAADTLAAVEWIVERARSRIPVVVDAASPAAALIPALKSRRVKLTVTSAGDMGKACGLFLDDIEAGRISHAGQPQLDDAVVGAKKRKLGDAGAFGWDRRDPGINIAPLVAVTLARYGVATGRQPGTGERRRIHRKAVVFA